MSVTGAYGFVDSKVNSKMSLPKDLSDSEEVRVSYVNENFTDFHDKVLKFVKNDDKGLVIVVSDFPQIFDAVIKTVSQEGNDDVITYYAWNESSSVTSLSEHTVKCLILPWGQSWERVLHKNKCKRIIAIMPNA